MVISYQVLLHPQKSNMHVILQDSNAYEIQNFIRLEGVSLENDTFEIEKTWIYEHI